MGQSKQTHLSELISRSRNPKSLDATLGDVRSVQSNTFALFSEEEPTCKILLDHLQT
jgi:hypothetical protein